jgi:hypothetical protein
MILGLTEITSSNDDRRSDAMIKRYAISRAGASACRRARAAPVFIVA